MGLGADSLLSAYIGDWGGFFFLGFLGLGFLAVYFSGRERWWAIIPGGVLLTLGFISVLNNVYGGRETGGFFFLGLGLTFLLVAVLASHAMGVYSGRCPADNGSIAWHAFCGYVEFHLAGRPDHRRFNPDFAIYASKITGKASIISYHATSS